MKLAIIGYGKMGKMIEQIACAKGYKVEVIVDPFSSASGIPCYKTVKEAAPHLKEANAAIEFTQPDTAVTNISLLAEQNIPIITGTTGWFDRMDEVKTIIEANNGSLLWASNFSIGVNMFYRIAWYAAHLANNFPEYDAGGFEAHHNKKIDSPSGTAKTLAEGVLSRIDRKKKIVWETLNRKIEADEFHFPSLRMGSVTGTHSLFFDSPADIIEITHTARSREGFASGAIQATKWLSSNNMKGIFTIDDMMKDLFKENI